MIYGLTGGIGSGKSAVSSILKEQGYYIVDADKLSRVITKKGSPVLSVLCEAFGTDILCRDGRLNRKKLAGIVYDDKSKYKKLNSILHSEILKLSKVQFEKHRGRDIIFDVPLLFETGWDRYCDKCIVVSSSMQNRLARIQNRDGISKQDAMRIIEHQMTDKERILKADIVIYNNSSLKDLKKEVLKKLAK